MVLSACDSGEKKEDDFASDYMLLATALTTLPRDTVLVHGDSRQQEAAIESAGAVMKDRMKNYSGVVMRPQGERERVERQMKGNYGNTAAG
jgi:hypothetical protein